MSVTPHNPVHWRVGSLTSRCSAKFGKERSQALTLVAALLPGQLVLNYGDEVELSTGGSYQELNLDDPSVKFFKQTLKASIALTMSQTQAREYVTPEDKPGIFVMNRVNENNFIVVANFGAEQASVPLEIYKGEGTTKVVVATPNAGIAVDENITTGEIQLPPDSAVALEIRNARK
ncbi:unnamed protein product [Allacma fusca]|uniref:Uncharacterized protein n=1 Tax=Allacma fusca TaxID=39272 RepID=A0A8J2K673_9HEXA|nr:unnamed protein product [Allacma fusca]